MAAAREPNPALKFLKDNAVVLGLVLLVAASVAVFAVTQASAASPAAAPSPAPSAMPTIGLGGAPQPTTAASATAAASTGTGSTPPPAGPEKGAQPSSRPTAAPSQTVAPVNAGTSQQGVKLKDWQPVAEGFSKAWANTGAGKDVWLAGIKPFVTPALYAQFGGTDVRNISPDTLDHVTLGETAGVQRSFHAWFTTGGHLFDGLMEAQNDGSWLVTAIDKPRG